MARSIRSRGKTKSRKSAKYDRKMTRKYHTKTAKYQGNKSLI